MNNVTQETIINLNDGYCIVIHRYGVDDYGAWFRSPNRSSGTFRWP